MDEIGWYGYPDVYETTPGGPLRLCDGHLRKELLLAKYGADAVIDVNVTDFSEDEAKYATATKDPLAAMATADAAKLDELLRDVQTSSESVQQLLDSLRDDNPAPGVMGAGGDEFDATPQDTGPTRTNVGEVWVIGGKHRLLVGDCTVAGNVERLMDGAKVEMVWTDPPYGVSIGDKNKYLNSIARSNRVEENLQNDSLGEDELASMLAASFGIAAENCTAGAAWYVAAPPGPLHLIFAQPLKHFGIWRQTIQWVKNNATLSPLGVSYHWQCEPIFYGWLPNAAKRFYGDRKQTTAWFIDRPMASPDHPTMKPVALVARAIEHSSAEGDIVYDPFLGSGTTLIAGHRLGRVVYGCEIEPKYCDVILRRAAAENLTAEKVN